MINNVPNMQKYAKSNFAYLIIRLKFNFVPCIVIFNQIQINMQMHTILGPNYNTHINYVQLFERYLFILIL